MTTLHLACSVTNTLYDARCTPYIQRTLYGVHTEYNTHKENGCVIRHWVDSSVLSFAYGVQILAFPGGSLAYVVCTHQELAMIDLDIPSINLNLRM